MRPGPAASMKCSMTVATISLDPRCRRIFWKAPMAGTMTATPRIHAARLKTALPTG